ncbi:hypothetical protein CHGG_01002 [Chaetomium globosum CBS 148.51]|uniref:Uncharacterized protein n=1 Tax=Chaetomium globosum (strain ATCC 6205 / CBS 148.51 / DSM 1962 / NBRC 6347 / NRRL 1970) TaxID=306901 RepID=Q2HFK2_CHAGB|nr:uncharacterized protein CHGG_01002 [Chaetomium globosum CBS 148.51]EAQ92767.1 hypothetical protein CHGG_01002 [Chaetomium globosum CBS 148.51]
MPSIFGKSGSTAGRAKTRHKSIRGTISAPIPIPTSPEDDEFPIRNPGSAKASIKTDDEFPIRQPGTGVAIPLPTTDGPGSSPEEPAEGPQVPELGGQQNQQPSELESNPDSGTGLGGEQEKSQGLSPIPEPASGSGGSGGTASPSPAAPPARRATNPALSTVRYSMISDSSKQTTQSKDSPHRKKSTLRSALGRLFGRGKKKAANGGGQDAPRDSGRESRPLGSVQHRSDPTALTRPNQRSPKRSASLPMSEFDRPLRSHSVGPDDIMAIESCTRPRASRGGDRADPDDPSEIGRAITSDSGGGLRRRSRSLSGLQGLAGIQRGGRRRSDEIRYWRESYNPGFMSPLSSNAHDDVDDTGMVDISAPESPAAERPPRTPPQPFNFGLLSKEMLGMKITHAADMDMRLGGLESRTLHLERAVDKLCSTVPGVKRVVDRKDMARPGSSRRSLETDTQSQISLNDYQTYTSSLQPPPYPAPKAKATATTTTTTATPHTPNRPTSGSTTVRGAASLPTLALTGGPDPSSRDEATTTTTTTIAKLRADLDAERAARQALEAQVKKLSERLNTLSTTMFAMVRGPSESRSHERLALAGGGSGGSGGGGGGGSALSLPLTPKMASPPLLAPPPALFPREQLSVFETDDDDDDDGEVSGAPLATTASAGAGAGAGAGAVKKHARGRDLDEGEVTEDDFQTPREGRTPMVGYGAFGEELRPEEDDDDEEGGDEDDRKRRKAARTLSLSQLTLGKGKRAKV